MLSRVCSALALAGIALILAFPPTFDIRAGTIVAVAIVAGFLVFVERSQTAAGSTENGSAGEDLGPDSSRLTIDRQAGRALELGQ